MIVFENPGEIDVRSISTFGVSVKEGDNPIGFFGTGLKYAIAVLLRTGHDVTIISGLKTYRFGTMRETVRGKEFEFVTMGVDGDFPLSIGFTTELGKQWELWMAYREIACNCMDELGSAVYTKTAPAAVAGKTSIIIKGDAFEGVHAEREKYILGDQPSMLLQDLEVRNRRGADLYYRGVRVMQFALPGLHTYNIMSKITLTEDRTVKNEYEVYHRIARSILQSKDEQFLMAVLSADKDYIEHHLDFHGWSVTPSDEFIKTVGNIVADRRFNVNESAMNVWKDSTRKNFTPEEVLLTKVQLMMLNKALDFCTSVGFNIRGAYPIKVVESLGEGGLGLAEDKTIFIAERVFHMGSKQIASTLIEEYIHLKHGYKDMTREMQNYLFDKIVSLGEEIAGEPL